MWSRGFVGLVVVAGAWLMVCGSGALGAEDPGEAGAGVVERGDGGGGEVGGEIRQRLVERGLERRVEMLRAELGEAERLLARVRAGEELDEVDRGAVREVLRRGGGPGRGGEGRDGLGDGGDGLGEEERGLVLRFLGETRPTVAEALEAAVASGESEALAEFWEGRGRELLRVARQWERDPELFELRRRVADAGREVRRAVMSRGERERLTEVVRAEAEARLALRRAELERARERVAREAEELEAKGGELEALVRERVEELIEQAEEMQEARRRFMRERAGGRPGGGEREGSREGGRGRDGGAGEGRRER